jgi:fatty acid desaturase
LALSAPFPISKASFWRKMRRDILGITGYRLRLQQFKQSMGNAPKLHQRLRQLLQQERYFLGSNLLLLGLLSALGVWWVYFVLWLLPLLSWYQVISRIRNIAEHAVVSNTQDPLRNTRTTQANWLMRAVLAPYWVNYHLEHHLFLFTPCWKLAQAHRMLVAQGLAPQMELAQGYGQVLRKATAAATSD